MIMLGKLEIKIVAGFIIYSLCTFSYSSSEDSSASYLAPTLEGRGIHFLSSTSTVFNDDTLIFALPDVWLDAAEQVDKLDSKHFDNKLPQLADTLNRGIHNTKVPLSFDLTYLTEDGLKSVKLNIPFLSAYSSNGNISFKFRGSLKKLLGEAQLLENVTLTLKGWHLSDVALNEGYLLGGGSHVACCNCDDECIPLWIIFGICTSGCAADNYNDCDC